MTTANRTEFVPYLGPEPTPSHHFAVRFQWSCALVAALWIARGILFLQRFALDRRLDTGIRTDALVASMRSNSHLLAGFWSFSVLATVFAVLTYLAWCGRRRTRADLLAYGESCVEYPVHRAVPPWLLAASGAALVAAIVATSKGAVSPGMVMSDLPPARGWSAMGAWLWALTWVSLILWPVTAEQSHARRLAASASYRQHPETMVPFLVPKPRPVLTTGTPAGMGWVLRTAVLAVALIFSMTLTIAGVSELLVGQYGRQALPWLIGSLVVDGLVIWAFVRRRRRARVSVPLGTAPV